ncbi:MAG: hypothetical protein ABL958_16865, partial [Bdellovibrionia bacterium]
VYKRQGKGFAVPQGLDQASDAPSDVGEPEAPDNARFLSKQIEITSEADTNGDGRADLKAFRPTGTSQTQSMFISVDQGVTFTEFTFFNSIVVGGVNCIRRLHGFFDMNLDGSIELVYVTSCVDGKETISLMNRPFSSGAVVQPIGSLGQVSLTIQQMGFNTELIGNGEGKQAVQMYKAADYDGNGIADFLYSGPVSSANDVNWYRLRGEIDATAGFRVVGRRESASFATTGADTVRIGNSQFTKTGPTAVRWIESRDGGLFHHYRTFSSETNGFGPETIYPFGNTGDMILSGFFDSDEIVDQVAVYGYSDRLEWVIKGTLGDSGERIRFGRSGDQPLVLDWDRDGQSELIAVRKSGSSYSWSVFSVGLGREIDTFEFGTAIDEIKNISCGDLDGDKKTDLWSLETDAAGARFKVRYGAEAKGSVEHSLPR